VPADDARARLSTVIDAGGRLIDGSDGRWRATDPEGNELVIVAEP
jgi:hypothetical protein